MNDRAATLIDGRRERIARTLGRTLQNPPADESPLADDARRHLVEEAQDLYWNELEWEHLTEEEATDQSEPLFEMMFPGLLAFVRGLLLTETMPDALAPAEPRPLVVRDLLAFLADRVLELEEELSGEPEEAARLRAELEMTDRLIDLVLYRYHGLHQQQIEQLEAARAG